VYRSAARRERDVYLAASMALLSAEGVALIIGRGDCPSGPFPAPAGRETLIGIRVHNRLMTVLRATSAPIGGPISTDQTYRPGVCNIGPAEIAARRRFALLALIVTITTLAVLVLLHAAPLVRFIVALPAAGTAIAYLQVALKFCVAFGSRGVFNFGKVGEVHQVEDEAARGRDRTRATRMILAGLAIGVIVGIVAVLLPL
jgi:hypothetical protein